MSNMVKTPENLLKIMKAAAMGDICFSHIVEYIKVGMTELEVAEEIEMTLMSLGAEGLSFPTICVSGTNSALPHGEPSLKVIEEGDFVTMDFGAVVEGYCGDMTRTIAMSHVSQEQQKVYDIVLEAQLAGLAACKAGVSCKSVDDVSRGIITAYGYGEYYIHGTGHGVGTQVHEPPTLNGKSSEVLEEYMPVTIEPGIYIPDKFGVRIEDLAIITEFGIINTVKSQKSLIII
ncbi:MAG: aminopeptidase P family protein [Clostridiales bacterium]|nr:aminopeptidase P family protein [Clostridiales bacterium]